MKDWLSLGRDQGTAGQHRTFLNPWSLQAIFSLIVCLFLWQFFWFFCFFTFTLPITRATVVIFPGKKFSLKYFPL